MVEQEGRNKTPLKKSMIIDTIERKSSYFPARYNSIAQATILNKGYAILNLLRKYPDDLIRIQPFPPFIGYKSAEGIKYEDVFDNVVNEKASLLGSLPTNSLFIIKKCINFGSQVPLNIGLQFEKFGSALNRSSKDVQEGVNAFLEKRKPQFTGD